MSTEGLFSRFPFRPPGRRDLLDVLSLCCAYLALSIAQTNGSWSPFDPSLAWPLPGLGIAFLAARGLGWTPMVVVASLISAWAMRGESETVTFALVHGLSAATAAVIAAQIMRRWIGFVGDFDSPRDVVALIAGAGMGAIAASLLVGIGAGIGQFSSVGDFLYAFHSDWLKAVLPSLFIVPIATAWLRPPGRAKPRRPIEVVGVTAILVVAVVGLRWPGVPQEILRSPVAALPFAILVLGASRLGPRWTATANAGVAVLELWSASRGVGPFVTPLGLTETPLLWVYLAVVPLTTLLHASIMRSNTIERDRTLERESLLRATVAQAPIILWTVDHDLRFTSSQGKALAELGLQPGQVVGMSVPDFFGGAEAGHRPIAALKAALKGASASYELAWAGREYTYRVEPLRDAAGRVVGAVGCAYDLTEHNRLVSEAMRVRADLQATLDAMGANVAIVDHRCVVLAMNLSWGRASQRAGGAFFAGVGQDYLQACRSAPGVRPEAARAAAEGLEAVLRGDRGQAEVRYTVSDAGGERHVLTRIDGFAVEGQRRAVVSHIDVTALALAENAARESEARFRTVIEQAPDAILIHDGERVLFANPAAALLNGVKSVDDMIGASIWSFVPSHMVDRVRSRTADVARLGGTSSTIELELKRADGVLVKVESTGRLIEFAGRQAYQVILRDVTARRQAEAAVRESESRWRALLRAMPDLIFRLSPDGRYIDYHAPPENRLLVPPERFLGRSYREVLPQDAAGRLSAAIQETTATGRVVTYVYTTARPGETPDQGHIEVRVVRSAEGEALTIVRDVTEAKHNEKSLRESEERYRALVDNAPVGIFVNRDDRFVYVNREGAAILGAEAPDQLLGQSIFDRIDPRYQELARERVRVARETGQALPLVEQVWRRMDGSPIDVEIMSTPCSFQGAPAIQVVVRDVTETKRLRQDLLQAQRLEAVGQLASGVAHDFNNLLTAISGHTGLARRVLPPSHPASGSLERVAEAAKQAASVTGALLTFARKDRPEKTPVSLNALVEDSVRLLRRVLPARIELNVEQAARGLWVLADTTQLQQVIFNLAINARDAMKGAGTLTIRLESGPPTDDTAILRVRDTGEGIPPEILPRVFEPFFTTKPRGQGTGLGLAIVQSIAKDHAGRVEVDSTPGKGSEFRMILPRIAAPPVAPATTEIKPHAADARVVLLAWPRRNTRELMASALRGFGHAVEQADDPAQLQERARQLGVMLRAIVLDADVEDVAWDAQQLAGLGQSVGSAGMIVLVSQDRDAAAWSGQGIQVLRKPVQISEISEAIFKAGQGGPSENGLTE